jgi:hypothetical protein
MPAMTRFKRFGAYVLVFLILLAGFVATGLWHPLDYLVYRTFYLDRSGSVQLADSIRLIDLPYRANDADNDPTEYRLRLADLLNVLASKERERPQAVILDIWLSNDNRGLREVADAIARLRERPAGPVDVYAAFNVRASDRRDATQLWKEHAQDLYRSALTGYGHTLLNLSMGVLSYEAEVEIPSAAGTREYIRALPIKVALDMEHVSEPTGGDEVVLPVGSEDAVRSHTVAFVHDGTSTSNGQFRATRSDAVPAVPDFDRKIVLIGSLDEDRHAQAPQDGPKLVAWALNDQLRREGTARRPLNAPSLLVGQVLAFALLTLATFALLFKYVTRTQTRPGVTACASVVASAGTLALFAAATLLIGYVVPVGVTLFGIALTGVMSWRFALAFLMTGVAEGAGRYDAFISYSRRDSDWVVKNVYEPLKAMRTPDGRELAVFFDRTDIGVGEAFTARYMQALVDSRFFIPVFSDDYYQNSHTRNEMDMAFKRSVEKKIVILPIAQHPGTVPEIYSHLNYLDATANPRFIEDIRKAILGTGAV